MRIWITLFVLCAITPLAAQETTHSPVNLTIVKNVSSNADLIKAVNQKIWNYAEVGLKETRSSKLLQTHLQDAGFKVKTGLSKMPTAFVAEYGLVELYLSFSL